MEYFRLFYDSAESSLYFFKGLLWGKIVNWKEKYKQAIQLLITLSRLSWCICKIQYFEFTESKQIIKIMNIEQTANTTNIIGIEYTAETYLGFIGEFKLKSFTKTELIKNKKWWIGWELS